MESAPRHIEKLIDIEASVSDIEENGYSIQNLPDDLSEEEGRHLLNTLEIVLGEGIGHKHAIDGVVSLSNDPTLYNDGIRRPQSDNGHQSPHTDGAFEQVPPSLMAVLCLNPADQGGETLLVDIGDAAATLTREKIDGLFTPDAIVVMRGEQEARHPALSVNARERIVGRFSNHEYNRSYAGNTKAEMGFKAIDAFLKDQNNHTIIPLESGDLILIDNERMAHGRNAFESRQPRHLLRKWYNGINSDGAIDTGIKSIPVKDNSSY